MLRNLLIGLYPRRWRRRYGEELRVKLKETRLTPAVVLDLLRSSLVASVREVLRTPWQVAGFVFLFNCQIQVMLLYLAFFGGWNVTVRLGPVLFYDFHILSHPSRAASSMAFGTGALLIMVTVTALATVLSWIHRRRSRAA